MNYTEESAIALYNSQGVVRGYTVYYEEIFEYFQQNLPCETVFLFDNCYSGRATATANLEDLKNVYPDMLRSFDQDLSLTGEYEEGVFTAMGDGLEAIIDAAIMAAKIAAPAADAVTDVTIDGKMQVKAVLEEMKEFLRSEGEKRCGKSLWPFDIAFELYTSYGYSVFVKHVRKGVLTGEVDYGKNGIVAIAEVYNYVVGHAEADEFLEKRMRYGGIVLAPQYRSDEPALPMVMLTPEARYVQQLVPLNEQWRYGVLQQAAVIVTASIEVDDRELSFSQISKVTVHLLGGEDSEKEAQANAQIDSSLTALHTKAKALADRAPETAHSDGKSAFYRLRLAEISAVPGASMHLGFYEIHNLDARNRTQSSEFAYAFDLTTGARQTSAALESTTCWMHRALYSARA